MDSGFGPGMFCGWLVGVAMTVMISSCVRDCQEIRTNSCKTLCAPYQFYTCNDPEFAICANDSGGRELKYFSTKVEKE